MYKYILIAAFIGGAIFDSRSIAQNVDAVKNNGAVPRQKAMESSLSYNQARTWLKGEMEKVRSKQRIDGDFVKKFAGLGSRQIELLEPYISDSSPRVRHRALANLAGSASRSDNSGLRTQAVNLLLRALDDEVGLVWQHASKDLSKFRKSDFDDNAKLWLKTRLLDDNKLYPGIIKAVGVAGLEDEASRLNQIFENGPSHPSLKNGIRFYSTPEWAAALAQARLGDEKKVNFVLEKVKAEDDETVKVTRLFGDLAYVRHPNAIAELLSIIESGKRLPPLKSNAPGTLYAHYAIDVLIQEFPAIPIPKKNSGVYTNEEIIVVKNWLASGNWKN